MSCPIHGECPVCKAQKALGDPRQGVEVTLDAEGMFWRNPAPHAAAPMVPTGKIGTFLIGPTKI